MQNLHVIQRLLHIILSSPSQWATVGVHITADPKKSTVGVISQNNVWASEWPSFMHELHPLLPFELCP